MPRRNRTATPNLKEAPKAVTSNGTELPVDPKTLMPDISLRIMKPGHPNYDPDKDSMIVGFVLGSKTVPFQLKSDVKKPDDVTPYHFVSDPVRGVRPGETKEPWGSASIDLSRMIGDYHTLPPIAIWKAGTWLLNVFDDPEFNSDELSMSVQKDIETAVQFWPNSGLPAKLRNLYIVSGEGTPGNNYYRIYVLPDKIGNVVDRVPHPLMWKANDFNSWGGGQSVKTTPAATKPAPAAPKKASIPAGVRMRCTACGHWFKMEDLPGHAQVCGADSDWAMMCTSECGCRNLDEASTPKQGFPRPKVEEKPKESTTAEEKPKEVTA